MRCTFPTRTLLCCLLMFALAVTASPVRATTLWVLENFEHALPPNPCLPTTAEPILFTGLHCDALSCPPGALVDGSQCNGAGGLYDDPIMVGGREVNRMTWVMSVNAPWLPVHTMSIRIRPETQVLEFKCFEEPCFGNVGLTYGGGVGWDVNPVAMGATEIRFRVTGSMSPDQPLGYYILLEDVGDGTEESIELSATTSGVITSPGEVVVRLADFTGDPGFDLNGVDWFHVAFGPCDMGGCSNSAPIPDFSVGAIRFETPGPVSARRTSWGSLKARYR